MRMRTVYILLAVLVVVTLASVWITQQVATVPVIATPAAMQSQPERALGQPAVRRPRHAFVTRPRTSIAVVEEGQQQAGVWAVADQRTGRGMGRRSSPDKAWVSTPAEGEGAAEGNTTAGVVTYHKYPTADESREMNARGIVMY